MRQIKYNELKKAQIEKNAQVAKLTAEEKAEQAELEKFREDQRAIEKELKKINKIVDKIEEGYEKGFVGADVIKKYAQDRDIKLGLWFSMDKTNSYERWETDANNVLNLYNNFDDIICEVNKNGNN